MKHGIDDKVLPKGKWSTRGKCCQAQTPGKVLPFAMKKMWGILVGRDKAPTGRANFTVIICQRTGSRSIKAMSYP